MNERADQFKLLSVAVDEQMDPKGFVAEKGYSWEFATTSEDVGSLYGVRGIPMTLFIDRKGRVAATQVGSMDKEQFVAYLEKIL